MAGIIHQEHHHSSQTMTKLKGCCVKSESVMQAALLIKLHPSVSFASPLYAARPRTQQQQERFRSGSTLMERVFSLSLALSLFLALALWGFYIFIQQRAEKASSFRFAPSNFLVSRALFVRASAAGRPSTLPQGVCGRWI